MNCKKISLRDQDAVLRHCIATGDSLAIELEKRGLTYDNLRYRNQGKYQDTETSSVTMLDDLARSGSDAIPAISFFLALAAWILASIMQALRHWRPLSTRNCSAILYV